MSYIADIIDKLSLSVGSELLCSDLSPKMLITVFLFVFIGGFVDSIAGGGGIITLPAYIMAGLPPHIALGTNKLSSTLGSSVAVCRYLKNGYVRWSLVLPTVLLALIGSHFGTRLQLKIDDGFLQYVLLLILPIVAFIVLKQRSFPDAPEPTEAGRQLFIASAAALFIGGYDGFYGPGTGTFLLIVLCRYAKLDVRTANGNTKIINFSSNISALITSILSGKVFLALGLIGAAAGMLGNFLGSGLAMKGGSKIVRPAVVFVLIMLTIKVISGIYA